MLLYKIFGTLSSFFGSFFRWFFRIRRIKLRIDKFLKVSRILKRRTVAQEACAQEKVLINGKAAKPSHAVAIGDVVELQYATGSIKFKILNVKETVKKDEAASLYEIITE